MDNGSQDRLDLLTDGLRENQKIGADVSVERMDALIGGPYLEVFTVFLASPCLVVLTVFLATPYMGVLIFPSSYSNET